MRRSRTSAHEELLGELERGKIHRGYLLIGEAFQREEALDVLLSAIVDPRTRAFNLDLFTAGEAKIGAMINAALSPPAMAERRTVVLKNCERLNAAQWKQLTPLVNTPPPASTCLIMSGDKVDGRSKVVAGARRWMKTLDFKPLYDNEIPGWIERRGGRIGKTITHEAAELLHVQVGESLGDLANELEKLAIFVGDRERIELEDVQTVVGGSSISNIFKLTDAIGDRQRATVIELVDHLLEDGQSAVGIVAMVGRYLVTLCKLVAAQRMGMSERQLRDIVDVHPYFLKQYVAQAARFDEKQLVEKLDFVLAAEDRLKSGRGRDQWILEELVYRLCKEDP